MLIKNTLGKTGLKVSKLCYGTLTIGPYHSNLSIDVGADLLKYAYEKGINFWDTAELYENYPQINKAIKLLNNPDDLIIASRSFNRGYNDFKESLKKTLESLELSSIKIFGLHELGGYQDFKESHGAFKALKEAKNSGLIHSIAITTHSVESVNIVCNEDWVDIVFPLYNKRGIGIKSGTVEDMTLAIEKAYKSGKGVYAMKVLAGGHMSQNVDEAFDFVLQNPNLDSIAVGMDNKDEIDLNIAIFTEQKEQMQVLKSKMKTKYEKYISIDPWCEGCQECMKRCPNQAIIMEFGQAKILKDKCVLCGYCASACKYFCIKVKNKL